MERWSSFCRSRFWLEKRRKRRRTHVGSVAEDPFIGEKLEGFSAAWQGDVDVYVAQHYRISIRKTTWGDDRFIMRIAP